MSERVNPLLEAWHSVYGADANYIDYDRPIASGILEYTIRREMVSKYSFAVPSDKALDMIASYGPVVEIGAGTGYWAWMLRQIGCDVVAYDVMLEAWNTWFPDGLLSEVVVGGTEMAEKHGDRTLLLVWPYMDSMAFEAVQCYTDAGGQRVIYIGEGQGGCTADSDFFLIMGHECWETWDDSHDCSQHPTPMWREVAELDIPQWSGIHDYLRVYERKQV